jgi:hypothetical protein
MKPPAKVSSSRTPNRQHRKRKRQSRHPSRPRPNRRHPRNSKGSRPAQDWMQMSSSTRPRNAYGSREGDQHPRKRTAAEACRGVDEDRAGGKRRGQSSKRRPLHFLRIFLAVVLTRAEVDHAGVGPGGRLVEIGLMAKGSGPDVQPGRRASCFVIAGATSPTGSLNDGSPTCSEGSFWRGL